MRSVLFDTETTGLNPLTGDRLIEIAALELINDLPTGVSFHRFVDPERDIPEEAQRVHGIAREFLFGKAKFPEIVADLLAFIGDDKLVAHNAAFDFGFLDAEFGRAGHPKLDRSRMVDTLVMAKTRFPGMPNSLDALCRRFGIDLSERTTHNALLDCKLLAEVYIELTGGRQRGLTLNQEAAAAAVAVYRTEGPRQPRLILPSDAELLAHVSFVNSLKDPLWLK